MQTHVLLVYPEIPPSFWSMKFAMVNYYERCLTMMRHTKANPHLDRPTHFAGRVMRVEGRGALLAQAADRRSG